MASYQINRDLLYDTYLAYDTIKLFNQNRNINNKLASLVSLISTYLKDPYHKKQFGTNVTHIGTEYELARIRSGTFDVTTDEMNTFNLMIKLFVELYLPVYEYQFEKTGMKDVDLGNRIIIFYNEFNVREKQYDPNVLDNVYEFLSTPLEEMPR